MIQTTMRPNMLISSKLKIHTHVSWKKWLGYQSRHDNSIYGAEQHWICSHVSASSNTVYSILMLPNHQRHKCITSQECAQPPHDYPWDNSQQSFNPNKPLFAENRWLYQRTSLWSTPKALLHMSLPQTEGPCSLQIKTSTASNLHLFTGSTKLNLSPESST